MTEGRLSAGRRAPDAPAPSVRVAAIVVTHHPELSATRCLIERLGPQVERVIVVDNGSGEATARSLRVILEAWGGELVALAENLGVAAAQNLGFERSRAVGATHVLLCDQDSLPSHDMVEQLLRATQRLAEAGRRVAAVGPVAVDARDPDAPLLFTESRWRAHQTTAPIDLEALVPAAFLVASGSLIPIDVLDHVGGKRGDLFIDWVDLEWGLRARKAGLELVAVGAAHLEHRMGDRVVRVPGRTRRAHVHSAERNYYATRNMVLLIRSNLMPRQWRLGYTAWLLRYGLYHVLALTPRGGRAHSLLAGLADGLRGRTGPRH